MDDRRFDALTRAFARGSSRRTALKGLFGGLVGGVAIATRLDQVGAGVLPDECDCVAVPCKTLTCGDGGECIYQDLCTDACTVCNPDTGACDPKVCDPCHECSRGVCLDQCQDGHCCDGTCNAECCVPEDCDPAFEYFCGTRVCDDGICTAVSNCTTGQRCCNYGTPEHYCAECCDDSECGSCQSCIDGTCKDNECCADSDCYGKCATCTDGACVSNCESGEYCCAYTNACEAEGKCCTDDDCDCGVCSQGTCYYQCTDEQECCDDVCSPIGTCCQEIGETCDDSDSTCCPGLTCCETPGGSWCGECCVNSDCEGACAICVEGTCGSACTEGEECCQGECVADGTCCRDSGETCAVTAGPGTQGNCCDDLLCCPNGDSGYCAECCHDSDCGACGFCSGGVCYGECSQGQECCERECVPIGTCCATEGDYCTLGEPDPGEEPVECCSDFVCCATEHSAACAECCDDSDCPSCSFCSNGTCYGECSQSQQCCNGECVEDDTCCRAEGSICGVTPTDDSAQLDCCDGLLCCDNIYYGASVCAECCVDHDCPHGGRCEQGECKHVCKSDRQCPQGTCCCNDGSCSGKCCHHPHPHPKPTPPDTVTTLPATGAGPNDERNTLLSAAALGAAAALFAAKKLRDSQPTADIPIED